MCYLGKRAQVLVQPVMECCTYITEKELVLDDLWGTHTPTRLFLSWLGPCTYSMLGTRTTTSS